MENFKSIVFLRFPKTIKELLPDGDSKLELPAFSVKEKGDLALVWFVHIFVGD